MTEAERIDMTRVILDRLDRMESRQETVRAENREDHDKIFTEIKEITKTGCPLGKSNSKAIEELRSRPERWGSIGFAAVSALGAIVSAIFGWRH